MDTPLRFGVLLRRYRAAAGLTQEELAERAFTCARAQCMPLPFSRASTTSLLALSTLPLPIVHALASRARRANNPSPLQTAVSSETRRIPATTLGFAASLLVGAFRLVADVAVYACCLTLTLTAALYFLGYVAPPLNVVYDAARQTIAAGADLNTFQAGVPAGSLTTDQRLSRHRQIDNRIGGVLVLDA
jgi:hypothetical protein